MEGWPYDVGVAAYLCVSTQCLIPLRLFTQTRRHLSGASRHGAGELNP